MIELNISQVRIFSTLTADKGNKHDRFHISWMYDGNATPSIEGIIIEIRSIFNLKVNNIIQKVNIETCVV